MSGSRFWCARLLGVVLALPHSRIQLEFGGGLKYYYNEEVFVENRGFLPDLPAPEEARPVEWVLQRA